MRSIFVSLVLAMMAISSWAPHAAERTNPGGVRDDKTPGGHVTPTATPIIQFDRSIMTDERARSLVEKSRFTYLDWFPCSGNPQGCMVVSVLGGNGRIFHYHLVDKRCIAPEPIRRTLDSGAATVERPVKQRGTERRANPGRDVTDPPSPRGPRTVIDDDDEGRAVSCLGGFRALVRARQENSFFADNLGFYLRLDQTFQVVNDGRWSNVIGFVTNAWELPVAGTGQTEHGRSYEVLDATDQTIGSGGDSYQSIAGSASTDVSGAEKCEARRDSEQAKKDLAVQLGADACIAGSWVVPDGISIEGVGEPGGVGGAVNLNYEFPFCEPAKNTADAVTAVSTTSMYEDCLANPGRYFPGDYAPLILPLVLHEDHGYLPVVPEKITLQGDCPPYTTKVTGFGVGGLSCLMTTPYTCEETDGECLCKKDQRIGSHVQTVCTES